MNNETPIVATRIGHCVVLAVPDDLGEDRLRQLQEVVRRSVVGVGLRTMVLDMSALKYADLSEFRELMALAGMVAMLGLEPMMVGLNPGIIRHWVGAGAEVGRMRTFLDLADALTALGLTVDETPS